MKIGVISDTHSLEIPKKLLNDLKSVDFIIHAGDFCTPQDLQTFRRMGEVRAVYGNMDGAQLRRLLPRRLIFEAGGVTIGVVHGCGAPQGILDIVRAEFENETVDAVVFGHSHQPFNEVIGHVLYFNPGSACDRASAPYRSYGILEIQSGKISGNIVKLKD
jgi:putative phosphoesterase